MCGDTITAPVNTVAHAVGWSWKGKGKRQIRKTRKVHPNYHITHERMKHLRKWHKGENWKDAGNYRPSVEVPLLSHDVPDDKVGWTCPVCDIRQPVSKNTLLYKKIRREHRLQEHPEFDDQQWRCLVLRETLLKKSPDGMLDQRRLRDKRAKSQVVLPPLPAHKVRPREERLRRKRAAAKAKAAGRC